MSSLEKLAASIQLAPTLVAYLIGALGSVAVEVAWLLRQISATGAIPPQWQTWLYPPVRILFAFVAAGPLAAVLSESAWTAFYVGITAPLFFDRAAAGIKAEPVSTKTWGADAGEASIAGSSD